MGCRHIRIGQPRKGRKNDSLGRRCTQQTAYLDTNFCRPYRGFALRGPQPHGWRRGLLLYRPGWGYMMLRLMDRRRCGAR